VLIKLLVSIVPSYLLLLLVLLLSILNFFSKHGFFFVFVFVSRIIFGGNGVETAMRV